MLKVFKKKRFLNRAIELARSAHGEQTIVGSDVPYFNHVASVIANVISGISENSDGDFALCVAALHDVVEDTHVQLDEVHDSFGTDMARLVHGVNMPEEMSRLEAVSVVADHMKFDSQIQTLKLADRISNVQLAVWEGNKRIMRFYAREHHIFKRAHTAGQSMDHMWSFLDDMLKPWTKKD